MKKTKVAVGVNNHWCSGTATVIMTLSEIDEMGE